MPFLTFLKKISPFVFSALFFIACSSSGKTGGTERSTFAVKVAGKSMFSAGSDLQLRVKSKIKPDSIQIALTDYFDTIVSAQENITIPTGSFPLGKQNIKVNAFFAGKKQTKKVSVTLFSNITPPVLTYSVNHTYPHDIAAYTQGLVYHDGYFFEGTGVKGRSSLRKVEIETGEILKNLPLEDFFFGEGVCVYNDKIFQLTWQANKGFIYNKETFEKIAEVSYPTEGWGLTSDSTRLYMSDGSNCIYILEPESFTQIAKIQVYDNSGPVELLNELEFIDGTLYANVYQTDLIVKIDIKTGAVLEKIDLNGILPLADRHAQVDVLNGIAYDNETKRIFVTGKNWPKLFDVSFVPKIIE